MAFLMRRYSRVAASRLGVSGVSCTAQRALSTINNIKTAEDEGIVFIDENAKKSKGAWESADSLTPKEVVAQLDRHIVGQKDAKKSVAVALRDRWRRRNVLPVSLREEISPKNILMIGPTGCGKTEIARRLAKLAEAPLVKVEATKYTEVGFHGRDVEDMIRDLVEASIKLTRNKLKKQKRAQVMEAVENKIIDIILGTDPSDPGDPQTRESFVRLYRNNQLDDRKIDIEIPINNNKMQIDAPGGQMALQELVIKVDKMFQRKQTEKKNMTVKAARPLLEEMESDRLLNYDNIAKEAIKIAEDEGIIFIDEIDKIVTSVRHGTEASSEGVQQDLLPIIEGCTVNTKYGNINTDHILFIASGAFHNCKPSDMLAELQGRLPIRVELDGLTKEDLHRILTEPDNNMIIQQQALLATEGISLHFTEAALLEISNIAAEVNKFVDNIGARRLHTIIERVLADVSFNASEQGMNAKAEERECHIVIDKEDVQQKVGHLVNQTDLSRFIL